MYSLRISTPVLPNMATPHIVQNQVPVFLSPRPQATGWTRRITGSLGDIDGQFTLTAADTDLKAAFSTWLGYDVMERVQAMPTWRGMITTMRHTAPNGIQREISLDDVYNRIYIRTVEDDTVTYSGPYDDPRSIAKYGLKEFIVEGGEQAPDWINMMGIGMVPRTAWPRLRIVGMVAPGEERLEIRVTGYITTLLWVHFAPAGANIRSRVDQYARDLLALGQYVNGSIVRLNRDEVAFSTDKRPVLHLLQEILISGSGDYAECWLQLDPNTLTARLEPRPRNPAYFIRHGVIYDVDGQAGAINTRMARPAVVTDFDFLGRSHPILSGVTPVDIAAVNDNQFYLDEFAIDAESRFSSVATKNWTMPVQPRFWPTQK